LRSSYKKLMRGGRYSWYLSGVRSSGRRSEGTAAAAADRGRGTS
jgi:hypothetical protein